MCSLWTVLGSDQETQLLQAADAGDRRAVLRLLEQGTPVDVRQPTNGWTPLFYALNREDLEMTTELVQRGAEVNAQSSKGFTPLMFAASNRNLKLMEFLISHGARLDTSAHNGLTALYVATAARNLPMARLLLSKGANPNTYTSRNENGRVQTPLIAAVYLGDTNMAGLLLDHGADLEMRNNRGDTPLLNAAILDRPDVLRWLIARGANVNARGHHGHSALLFAAYNGRTENIKILLQAGADPLAKACNSEEPDQSGEFGPEVAAREGGNDEALALVLDAQRRAQPTP